MTVAFISSTSSFLPSPPPKEDSFQFIFLHADGLKRLSVITPYSGDGEEISAAVTKPCLLKSGGCKNLQLPYDLMEVIWDYLNLTVLRSGIVGLYIYYVNRTFYMYIKAQVQ